MCGKKGIILMEMLLFLVILSVCVLLVTTIIHIYRNQQRMEHTYDEILRDIYQT